MIRLPDRFEDQYLNRQFQIALAEAIGYEVARRKGLGMDTKLTDVKRWITVKGTPIPIGQNGKPVSKIGKQILNGKQRINKNEQPKRKFIFVRHANLVSGEAAHKETTHKFNKTEYTAVRHYTADTEKGHNGKINTAYRTNKSVPADCKKTADGLDSMFARVKPLTKSIRVYRGIPKDIAERVLKTRRYYDDAFMSASTHKLEAERYAKASKCVLVIDAPAGMKACSVAGVSRKPRDKEILFNRSSNFEMTDYNIVNGILYIHLEGAKDDDR